MPTLHTLLTIVAITACVACGLATVAVGIWSAVKVKPEPEEVRGDDNARGMVALLLVFLAFGLFWFIGRT